MRKRDLVRFIARRTRAPVEGVEAVLESLEVLVAAELARGGEVYLGALGKFRVVARRARRVGDPNGGEPLQLEARVVPTFRPTSRLKQAVWPAE